MVDLSDILDRILEEYSDDEILNEFGSSIVASYIRRNKLASRIGDSIHDNEDVVKLIKGIISFLHPRGYLSKEDVKKELCDFIDFWYY